MTVELYLGDCMDILPTLATNSADAVITDPPFGIGYKYASYNDTAEGYGEWIWTATEMAEGLCLPGSPVFIWQSMPNIRSLATWFPREWRIFCAAKNFVQMRPGIPMQYSFDPVVVWWTPGEPWTAGTATRDWHVANTNPSCRKKLGDYVKGHPCPRPLSQVRHMIEQWVRPGGTVLDFTMGSGTTGVACIQSGRSFIGIEIEQEYYDIAVKRIADAQAAVQGRLL